MNADKGGVRPYLRAVLKTLRRLDEAVDDVANNENLKS